MRGNRSMALIKCPECGKEISDKAEACPNCGCPIKASNSSSSEINDSEPGDSDQISNGEEDSKYIESGKEKKAMSKKTKGAIGVFVGVIIIGGIVLYLLTANMRTYDKAIELLTDKNYAEASKIFKELDDYKDASVKYKECKMNIADDLFVQKKYKDAIKLFDELGDFGDAEAKSDESYYLIAKSLCNEENYKEAEQIYLQLAEYKDSKELSEKCKYEQTVDGQFIRELSKGLVDRWDYSEEGYLKEFDKEFDDMESSEYMEYLKKCVNYELDKVNDFQAKEFLDEALGEKALRYIESLNNGLAAIDYYSMDNIKYNVLWNDVYSTRVLLIRDFVNNHGLVVDEAHQKTLDEFITNASIVDEQNALDEAINSMVDGYTHEAKDNGYGNISYTVNMENTTDVTFEYFGCSVDVLDENGTIIFTGYTGEIKQFEPGQKAQLDVYTGVQGASLKFHPNYYVQQ